MSGIQNLFPRLAAFCLLLLLAGCSSSGPTAQRRFHEQSAANLVVSFPGWESITITRPDTTEDGFLPFYNRAQARQALAALKTEHNLAVVVCSFNYNATQDLEHRQSWSAILGELGFHRVVFLRAGAPRKLNGLLILQDVPLSAPTRAGI